MNSSLSIVTATEMEIQPLMAYLHQHGTKRTASHFLIHDIELNIIVTGIGILATTYSLMNHLKMNPPNAWIQMGIGGAMDPSLELSKVYVIESERLFGFGAQNEEGRIISPFELGWLNTDQSPFTKELLDCPHIPENLLMPQATGMTTLYSHGSEDLIREIVQGPHGQIENMEGVAFFYVSLMEKIPFLSLRSISNYVTSRDTKQWRIKESVHNLNEQMINLLANKLVMNALIHS